MRTIYLIRHGIADHGFGRKHVCLGQKDVPLSHEGEKQAERLARCFKGRKIDGVYSSPLERCVKTARIVLDMSGHSETNISTVADFMEVDAGEWDGMTFDEIRKKFPEAYEERGRHLGRYATPGGESLEHVGERFAAAFEKVLAESSGDLLIAAHAGVIRAFLCRLTGTDIDELQKYIIPYASETVIEIDDGAEMRIGETEAQTGGENNVTGTFEAGGGQEILSADRDSIHIRSIGLRPTETLSLSEVDRIWAECGVTEMQRRHMEAVADMAMNLIGYDMSLVRADWIETAWPFGGTEINARALYYAALLHDIKRAEGGRVHATRGAEHLLREGYQEIAAIVKKHHDPDVYRAGKPVSEAEILFYADKLVMEDRMVSVEERFARSREKCASEEALRNHERQYRAALGIQEKVLGS